MQIAITGSSGFVGQAVSNALSAYNIKVRALVRSVNPSGSTSSNFGVSCIKGSDAETSWLNQLMDIDCIIHCAAVTHVMVKTKAEALAIYRAINVESTRRLAEQAAQSGVKRLIFLSSVKVNGEQTSKERVFTYSDIAKPEDPYGISKWEAEQALLKVSAKTGLEVVIIRPPLVYGPSVKGNFLSILQWLARGIPLPLGAVHNQRSLVGINNLVDLIVTCIDHPAATHYPLLVSDGRDMSTTELLRKLGIALSKPARLLPLSASIVEVSARLIGKRAAATRLLGNLQVDISKTKDVLDWSPPVSVDEGLRETADWYLSQR